MKRIFTLLLVATAAIFSGCNDDENIIENIHHYPQVDISLKGSPGSDSFTVIFTPNALTDHFVYAIGLESDREAFEKGTLENIKTVQVASAGSASEVTFDALDVEVEYTVFAKAFAADQDGESETSSIRVQTIRFVEDTVFIENVFTGEDSVCFKISTEEDKYFEFMWAFGDKSDREAFENGTLDGVETRENSIFCYPSFYGLEPNTEYTFFAQAIARDGSKTRVFEVPVTTAKKGTVPAVEFSIDEADLLFGYYSFTLNEYCSRAVILFQEIDGPNNYDYIFFNEAYQWNGNIRSILAAWDEIPGYTFLERITTSTNHIEYKTVGLTPGEAHEAYVLVYDHEMTPALVQRFNFTTPEYDDQATPASMTLSVSNITATSAEYTFLPSENIFFFAGNTTPKDWFDDLVAEKGRDAAVEYLFYETMAESSTFGYYHKWNMSDIKFTVTDLEANTDYYGYAFPMNKNGVKGVGNVAMTEFKTTN